MVGDPLAVAGLGTQAAPAMRIVDHGNARGQDLLAERILQKAGAAGDPGAIDGAGQMAEETPRDPGIENNRAPAPSWPCARLSGARRDDRRNGRCLPACADRRRRRPGRNHSPVPSRRRRRRPEPRRKSGRCWRRSYGPGHWSRPRRRKIVPNRLPPLPNWSRREPPGPNPRPAGPNRPTDPATARWDRRYRGPANRGPAATARPSRRTDPRAPSGPSPPPAPPNRRARRHSGRRRRPGLGACR